jgi:hypothetical protein
VELQERVADLVPAWPLAHEAAYAAVSTAVVRGDGTVVDPAQPEYERGLLDWRLSPPGSATPSP